MTYTRDATDRILSRTEAGTTTGYGFSGPGDSPTFTTGALGVVLDRFVSLPGGVSLTKRTTGDVWSYPNIHGDMVATANAAGLKQGTTLSYDPYGTALGTTLDNATGNFDYGWLGQHERGTEHAPTLTPTIEMGARPYVPSVGHFLGTDSIEGGSSNNYDYTNGDPVNGNDLTGTTGHRRLPPGLDSKCLAGHDEDLASIRCMRYRIALVTGDSDYFYKNKNLNPKPGKPNSFLKSIGDTIEPRSGQQYNCELHIRMCC